MRGIISSAAYIPYWRIERSAIGAFHGGGGKGTRSVASYDEDSTTLAVEAARLALASAPAAPLSTLWFATSSPTYLEKTNATVIHAALQLDDAVAAFDAGGAVRSGVGALRAALRSSDQALVTSADLRTGLANSPDERDGGDAGAAFLVGDATDDAPVIAAYLGGASVTHEFLDRWRTPGDARTRQWEERFGENNYVELGQRAIKEALADAGVEAQGVQHLLFASASSRAANQLTKKTGATAAAAALDLAATVGHAGAAHAGLSLAAAIEVAVPGDVIVLVGLTDGADVLVFRATDAIASWSPTRSIADQIAAGNAALPYAKFLSWRGVLPLNPPNRPEPARASASAAGRSIDWKFGFVASRDRESGAVHMPPARVSFVGGRVDEMEPLPMADATGTVVTFTVDRMAYSPSPPVIFAVVDFEGGGRLPIEVCDVTVDDIAVGMRVEMTFRRLNSADGIANYFWKARPIRGGNQ